MPRLFDDAFEFCGFFFCLLSVCLQENVFFIPFHTIIILRVHAYAHARITHFFPEKPFNPSQRHLSNCK